MTSNNRPSNALHRRRVLKAAGAAALAAGLAGCNGDLEDESPAPGGGDEVPVFEVTSRGVDAEGRQALAEELGLGEELTRTRVGELQFVDAERFASPPRPSVESEPIQDEDTPDGREVGMAFDIQAIEEMGEPPAFDGPIDTFEEALEAAEVHPKSGFPGSYSTMESHSTFRILEDDGSVRVERDLDTAVYLRWQLDGVPYEGAGAKVRARYRNLDDTAVPTDVRHSFRGLEEGDTVELTDRETVRDRYRSAVESTIDAQEFQPTEPRLVYLAPPLRRPNDNPIGEGDYLVGTVLPHYEVGGTVTIGGEEAELLREYVPAIDDEEYVPSVEITASAEGNRIDTDAEITGGTPPYKAQWSLSKGSLDRDPGTAGDPIDREWAIRARDSISETTLTLEVEDANGVTVRERTELSVSVEPSVAGAGRAGGAVGVGPAASDGGPPSTYDTGFRSTDFVSWCRGFVREASRLTSVASDWDDTNVWENDFTPSKDDDYGLDTSDHFFTAAHGFPRGFTVPNNCCDDGWIMHGDADGAWGTYDNEWFSLCSCNVLAPDDGKCGACNGMSRVDRWGDEFDGLHQFQGFQTLAHVHGNFPDAVARNILGRPYFAPLPVRVGWILAIENHQPGPSDEQAWDKRGVIMGPIDEGNNCNYWDYFHDNGPVGPDISGSDVDGYWEIVAGTGG